MNTSENEKILLASLKVYNYYEFSDLLKVEPNYIFVSDYYLDPELLLLLLL
jgi:hypothetical protein